ncbi:MAG TPA: YDG domain-containing protein, partial [Burkholderiaceae bacterium]|nr:YDG domain-containing protein [Burkholderiaceae bacterium]
VYDGTTTATLIGGTLSGLIPTDSGNLVLTQAGNFASSNVGNGISITASDSISGTAAGNYTLIEPTGLFANIVGATIVTQTTPTILASNSYIIAINTESTTLLNGGTNPLNGSGTGGGSTSGTSTNSSGAANNGNVKKLYCN